MRHWFVFSVMICCATQLQGQAFERVHTFHMYDGAQIEYNKNSEHYRSYELVEGDRVVFEFNSNNAGDPGNHSKAPSRIAFQIPREAESFSWTDQEIEDNGGIYMQMCKCQDKGIQQINKGSISGKRRDFGTWIIDIDVRFKGRTTNRDYHIQSNGEYTTGER